MPASYPTAMSPRLTLSELTVRRGPDRVIEDLSLEIRPGRIFWIVGPNGGGKSSLLRVLVGLDRPRGGRVRRTPADPRAWLYFHSEMALPASATPGDWHRLVGRLTRAAADGRTPLWPDVDPSRRMSRLSTGERKRVLLDALLRLDGSLVLDEPFEHLSPDAKRALTRRLEVRARHRVVVVATNQATERALRDGGLRLEAGVAEPLGDTTTGPGDPIGALERIGGDPVCIPERQP